MLQKANMTHLSDTISYYTRIRVIRDLSGEIIDHLIIETINNDNIIKINEIRTLTGTS